MGREEEHEIAVEFSKTSDQGLANKLVSSNLRLVVKIAREYQRTNRSLLDLVQEGNLGLMHAVKKYDPNRGIKLSSYASWWIRAYMLKSILANWRIVKIGTTQAQRKLFFNLHKERDKLERQGIAPDSKTIATILNVDESDVAEMDMRLNAPDAYLDAPVPLGKGDDIGTHLTLLQSDPVHNPDTEFESTEFNSALKTKMKMFAENLGGRELTIFRRRLLADEPATLLELADHFEVTRERVRQIETKIKQKLRYFLENELGELEGLVAV